MEEITTRFEIVRLAVKMADHETVAVQAGKLREISLDEDLNEIISLLESKNYRQALYLMKGYVTSLDDSFFEKPVSSSKKEKKKTAEVSQETQNLFDIMQPQSNQTINLDDMLRMTKKDAEKSIMHEESEHQADAYIHEAKAEVEKNKSYLDIHKNRAENKTLKPFEAAEEEILVAMDGKTVAVEEITKSLPEPTDEESVGLNEEVENNVHPAEEFPEEDFSETENSEAEIEKKKVEAAGNLEETEQDTELSIVNETVTLGLEDAYLEHQSEEEEMSDAGAESEHIMLSEEETVEPNLLEVSEEIESDTPQKDAVEKDAVVEKDAIEDEVSLLSVDPVVKEIDTIGASQEESEKSKIKQKEEYLKESRRYSPISYIDQKFRNMRHQFPQTMESEGGIIDEVKVLLRQVATEGYTENDIYDAIQFFQEKKSEGKLAEAAQMLLLAAASESKYAQLMLARELFKGEVLKVDYPEAFTQINRLAEHDYPEAICDLAQLYEYGYGIKKDKKTAQLLYEEAAEMGVARAQKHVERFSAKKGLLSAFFK